MIQFSDIIILLLNQINYVILTITEQQLYYHTITNISFKFSLKCKLLLSVM